MVCTYTFAGPDGNKLTITGKNAFKAYLANGGLQFLAPERARPFMVDRPFNGIEIPATPIGDRGSVVVDGIKRTVFNSEGKPIHWSEEGIRNFWRWFGDSKVVDDRGRPLVVYHGTKGDVQAFDLERAGTTTDSGGWGSGIYFAADPDYAAVYAGKVDGSNIIPVYVSLKNPLIVDARERTAAIRSIGLEVPRGGPTRLWSQQFADALRQRGHDGVLVTLDG